MLWLYVCFELGSLFLYNDVGLFMYNAIVDVVIVVEMWWLLLLSLLSLLLLLCCCGWCCDVVEISFTTSLQFTSGGSEVRMRKQLLVGNF